MSGGFRFKRFGITQDSCAMKVSTDGVLLGAWLRLSGTERRILDIGTGSGLIALMAAQRSEGSNPPIDAVEIVAPTAEEAARNAASSPWAERVKVIAADIRKFVAEPYDIIVSNPPYFEGSLRSPDALRTTARHTDTLGYDELFAAVGRLLSPEGAFSVIVPSDAVARVIAAAASAGLYATRLTAVSTRVGAAPKRTLAEFAFRAAPTEKTTLSILSADGQYTDEYRTLTADFYLDF